MDWKTLFAEHIKVIDKRFNDALIAEGLSGVLIAAGELKRQFLDDMDYPFKVNPHFKTWVPLTQAAGSWIVKEVNKPPVLIFYSPDDYWHAPADFGPDFWRSHFVVETARSADEVWAYLPEDRADFAFIGEWQQKLSPRLGQLEINPERLLARLHFYRQFKTEYEIEAIKAANTKAVRGHLAAKEAFQQKKSELDIHLAYLSAAHHAEHELPYGNIVALNEHAAILHYQQQVTTPPDNPLNFLIDAGAEQFGYAADITRTYAFSDGQWQEAIQAFDALQRSLVDAVQPGVSFPELHHKAHQLISAWLIDFGFVQGAPEHIVESGLSRAFFPHGLGHFIGLQVHDVAGKQANTEGERLPQPEHHPYLRLLHELQPGHVVTVEPGVYFIPSLLKPWRNSDHRDMVNWAKVDEYMPYGGIRIEDDVVVTENGHRNLTREAFDEQA